MKKIVLATPRGFCAGVDRAIHVVEKAIEKFGTPIYVRHEIVHNKFVDEELVFLLRKGYFLPQKGRNYTNCNRKLRKF